MDPCGRAAAEVRPELLFYAGGRAAGIFNEISKGKNAAGEDPAAFCFVPDAYRPKDKDV